MTTSEQAAVAYANAAYLRAAAISYAKSIGEPIAHFNLKPGQVTDQELPPGPLGSVLLQKRPTLQYYNTAPMWINVGFAVELGLKGLFLVTKGTTPPRGHDTSALLGLLDQSERAAIEAEMLVVVNELEISGVLEQGMDRNDLAVQSALDRFGTDFVHFRYLYEGTQLPDHAETGWIRLRAPSVWFSLDAILRVLKSKLESAGCTGIEDISFEPLAASTL